ncbi:nuclear speckle splicing regulatory protein 1 [Dendrobium catenatum]|uniref:Nuclear speckle splicing regulatory protein 1 N-terminal domain-containing protein n=1 Tax=Dendrobium catenatum TaxID=906689 RepID=A0A2I0VN46_9ASPA|nr:nuclear speckle splicing regulatory protein 1 [Dendrobium catenatum]XP_020687429.1 nuclear speckle splicing regulatory protein 1 [Dendrobium catenatum]PKU64834.1 hypothetical protein MA16_Dca020913 [Dendrobium catenatum]
MKKYGLQLRFPPDQQRKMASKPPIQPPASVFGDDDDDDDDVTKEKSRQAVKSRALQMIDEQQKKTLEEDPLAFDYDGVYDEMKSTAARSRVQDQSKREPKYITAIMESVKKREREHEIIYERKLLKERSKDDHIFEDKEKFVTRAYKQKLAERAKWLEEERLRGLREEKDDVTKKTDLTDFYFGLNKNVAFGAHSAHTSKPTKEQSISISAAKPDGNTSNAEAAKDPKQDREQGEEKPPASAFSEDFRALASESDPVYLLPQDKIEVAAAMSDTDGKQISSEQNIIKESLEEVSEKKKADQATGGEMDSERFKRSEDAVAAARERFLARRKAKQQ